MGILIVGLVAAVAVVGSQRSVSGMAVMPSGEAVITPSSTTAVAPPVIPPPSAGQGPLGGPTYGPGDQAEPVSMPNYIPFDFSLPAGWVCVHTVNQPLDSRVICADEANNGGAAGWIGTSRCPGGCGTAAQDEVRAKLPVDGQFWKPIDDVTYYASVTGTLGSGQRVVRIAMTCAYASAASGGTRDTLAVVMMTGPPETKETLQKIANEVRLRVPA